MDAFSTAAAALALLSATIKATKRLLAFLNRVQKAPDQVLNIIYDIQGFQDTLGVLESVIPLSTRYIGESKGLNAFGAPPETISAAAMLRNLHAVLENCLELTNNLTGRLENSLKFNSRTKRFKKSVQWEISDKDVVEQLRRDISSHKLTLVIACNAMTLFQANGTGDTIMERLDIVQNDIQQVRRRIDGSSGGQFNLPGQRHSNGSNASVHTARSFVLKRFLDETESLCSSSRPSSRDPSMILSSRASVRSASIRSAGSHNVVREESIVEEAESLAEPPSYKTTDSSADVAAWRPRPRPRPHSPPTEQQEEQRRSWLINSSDDEDADRVKDFGSNFHTSPSIHKEYIPDTNDDDKTPGQATFFNDDEDESVSLQLLPGIYRRFPDARFRLRVRNNIKGCSSSSTFALRALLEKYTHHMEYQYYVGNVSQILSPLNLPIEVVEPQIMLSEKCFGCKETITDGEAWYSDFPEKRQWHNECLKCEFCKTKPGFVSHRGYLKIGYTKHDHEIQSAQRQPWISDSGTFACSECIGKCVECHSAVSVFDEVFIEDGNFVCGYCAMTVASRWPMMICLDSEARQTSASRSLHPLTACKLGAGGPQQESPRLPLGTIEESSGVLEDEILIMLDTMADITAEPEPLPVQSDDTSLEERAMLAAYEQEFHAGLPTPPISPNRKPAYWKNRFAVASMFGPTPPSSAEW